jgi:Tfp pilus assembly protein PilO
MKNKVKKFVFFVFLISLTFLASQYMLKPINQDLKVKRDVIDARFQRLTKLIELDGSEKANFAAKYLNRQIEELQGAIEFFESKLPPTSQIHKVLEQVTVIAQRQGLNTKTFKTLKPKQNNGYIEQPLKMEMVGDFASFYSFLLELETLDRITKVRELKLKKHKTEEGQITADCVLSIFFQNT